MRRLRAAFAAFVAGASLIATTCATARLPLPVEYRRGSEISLAEGAPADGWTTDPAVPLAIFGDSTRSRQLLLNASSNAAKFSEKGSVTSMVMEGDGDELGFAVRDSGISLSPEGISKRFKRFSQAESSTARKYGGTRLGLMNCREVAELMGGTMTADAMQGDHEMCLVAGMDDDVTKPIRVDALVEALLAVPSQAAGP